jgi:hypothetical protein
MATAPGDSRLVIVAGSYHRLTVGPRGISKLQAKPGTEEHEAHGRRLDGARVLREFTDGWRGDRCQTRLESPLLDESTVVVSGAASVQLPRQGMSVIEEGKHEQETG